MIRARSHGLSRTLGIMLITVAGADCDRSVSPPPTTAEPDVGAVNLALTLPDGTALPALHFILRDGGGAEVRQGNINLVDPHATVSAVVGAVPTGLDYTVALSTFLADGPSCAGVSMPFAVSANVSTFVSVVLRCHSAGQGGAVNVGGTMDMCPVLTSYTISPLAVSPGGAIQVSAVGSDADPGGVLVYTWTADAGHFDAAAAPTTTYHCPASGGAQTLTVAVGDGAVRPALLQPRCGATASIVVDCGTPAGGGAGAREVSLDSCPVCEAHFCAPQGFGCSTLSGGARASCEAAVACMRTTRCAIGDDASFCYCGSASQGGNDAGCARQPLGPCVGPFEAADPNIVSTDTVQQRFNKMTSDLRDASLPIGKATGLIGCDASSCDTPTTCAGQF